ncbi:Protein-S-isoprenylcysteine O-methyltransferase [Meyerozyma sp. JA9]|nr:Protein-S-isoprenylcysteine O-methyltransferase [Meyerozyma sp. JA9]
MPRDNYSKYDPSKVNLATVALKAFGLGVVLSVCLGVLVLHVSNTHQYGVTTIRITTYLALISTFHMLEFMSTCLFNNSQVDDDSFILNDTELHLVLSMSLIEVILEPFVFDWSTNLGLILALLGQLCRTGAMYTARESFNHYIQQEKDDNHVLIKHGIYKYIRHPSYFGFFWWFIGTQLYLGNTVILVGGSYKLWKFFKARIEYEELLLIKFFKNDYVRYRAATPVGIPFIH